MLKAYTDFWKGYVDFTGRSTRADYWWAVLANTLVMLIFLFFALLFGLASPDKHHGVAYSMSVAILCGAVCYYLAALLPMLTIQVRRLRDGGYHWAFIFLYFLGGIGSIALIILYCMPTKVTLPPTPTNPE